MKVRYKHSEEEFLFDVGDHVTLVVGYLYAKDEESYSGTITKVEDDGIWCLLDDDDSQEEFFSFADLENIIADIRRN